VWDCWWDFLLVDSSVDPRVVLLVVWTAAQRADKTAALLVFRMVASTDVMLAALMVDLRVDQRAAMMVGLWVVKMVLLVKSLVAKMVDSKVVM